MTRTNLTALLAGIVAFSAAVASAQTTRPSYPGTTAGLEQYFKDILDAADTKDADRLLALCNEMVLPDHAKWFKDRFGKEMGAKQAANYEADTRDLKTFGTGMAVMFIRFKEPKKLRPIITCVEVPEDPNAKINQVFALKAMIDPVPLYTATFKQEGSASKIFEIWSFVYVDGQFRFAGQMRDVRDTSRH